MPSLDAVARKLRRSLDEKDRQRERALAACREVQRDAKLAIKRIHRGEDPSPLLDATLRRARVLGRQLARHPEVEAMRFVGEMQEELAEAVLVRALLEKRPLPDPSELPVTPEAYLLGMGDAIGELRRACLDRIRRGDDAGAQRVLRQMEELFSTLVQFDHPAAVADVRRKQDVARALVERTQGEVAVAVGGRRLEKKIEDLSSMLDELEGRKPSRKGKGRGQGKGGEDLDVDSAWGSR
ncbi:MAG TPA: translin family protein [Candidatus Thermoplasmatota archaeon]|nr:translin family protein [Candidatus Thermoplasmatota archaeon]